MISREALGRKVREVWLAWAREQPNPKPSWLLPWESLSEPEREVDRRIGEALAPSGDTQIPSQPYWAWPDEMEKPPMTAEQVRIQAMKAFDDLVRDWRLDENHRAREIREARETFAKSIGASP